MNPQTAVATLIALGWSESRIAKEVGTSQPTVHRIKHGLQRRGVSFETAKAVIDLAESEQTAAADGLSPCGS
jgi:DNA-binding NarL/FixJ family response regulator